MSDDLFEGLNTRLLRNRWVKSKYKNRKALAAKIFEDCFYEILLDIINNNVTFVLPLRFGNYAEISMKQYSDINFKKLYNKGKFNDIDFVLSQFTGNQLVFKYIKYNKELKEKSIYVNKELKKLIQKFTNEGKQYY